MVWIHLRKERFPNQPNVKLSPKADGPFKIVQKNNDNAYKVELSGTYGISATINFTKFHHIWTMKHNLTRGRVLSNPRRTIRTNQAIIHEPLHCIKPLILTLNHLAINFDKLPLLQVVFQSSRPLGLV